MDIHSLFTTPVRSGVPPTVQRNDSVTNSAFRVDPNELAAAFDQLFQKTGLLKQFTPTHPPTGGPRPKSIAKMVGAATTHLKAGGKIRQTKVATH